MKLSELQGALPMEVHYAPDNLNGDITGVYCSDLLSNVMGQAKPGMLWVTMQAHPNIVAVAWVGGYHSDRRRTAGAGYGSEGGQRGNTVVFRACLLL